MILAQLPTSGVNERLLIVVFHFEAIWRLMFGFLGTMWQIIGVLRNNIKHDVFLHDFGFAEFEMSVHNFQSCM